MSYTITTKENSNECLIKKKVVINIICWVLSVKRRTCSIMKIMPFLFVSFFLSHYSSFFSCNFLSSWICISLSQCIHNIHNNRAYKHKNMMKWKTFFSNCRRQACNFSHAFTHIIRFDHYLTISSWSSIHTADDEIATILTMKQIKYCITSHVENFVFCLFLFYVILRKRSTSQIHL